MSTILGIVLVETEISPNTGNIARICIVARALLHQLVNPLGFELSDRYLKSPVIDYWKKLEGELYESIDRFSSNYKGFSIFITTKASYLHNEVLYSNKPEFALNFLAQKQRDCLNLFYLDILSIVFGLFMKVGERSLDLLLI